MRSDLDSRLLNQDLKRVKRFVLLSLRPQPELILLSKSTPYVLVVFLFLCIRSGLAEASDYETIRFYDKRSKPEKLETYAISPDGKYLALAFDGPSFSNSTGLSIIDLDRMELMGTAGTREFFSIAFSSDSKRILALGNSGKEGIVVDSRSAQRVELEGQTGKIGIEIEEKNGKLLISQVLTAYNATLTDQIKVGDELLAVNYGATPEFHDDSDDWISVTGQSREQAIKILSGPPDTWLQLQLGRRGVGKPKVASVQRQWRQNAEHELPGYSDSLTLAVWKGNFKFRSADTGKECAFVSLRDIEPRGQHAFSRDGKQYCRVGRLESNRGYGLEVHSLETGHLLACAPFEGNGYSAVRFTPDADQVLVGTRDSIQCYDLSTGEWSEAISLTSKDARDPGRIVKRRLYAGLGFPGDLYITRREVVFDKPAALHQFAVSPSGGIAIASETGDIVLANLETKSREATVGEGILGARAEMIEFTPNGNHLVAYANGLLHIFKLASGEPVVDTISNE